MCPAVPTTTYRVTLSPKCVTGGTDHFACGGRRCRADVHDASYGSGAVPGFAPIPAPLENLDEPEIDLTTLGVHAHDLHRHRIAQPVGLPGVLPEQRVVGIQKPVVVIRHTRDVHEAFHERLDQLHEQPETR